MQIAHTQLQVPPASAQLPPQLHSSKTRRIALADWLARKLSSEANRASAAAAGQAQGWHGAKGGDVHVDMPGRAHIGCDGICLFCGSLAALSHEFKSNLIS